MQKRIRELIMSGIVAFAVPCNLAGEPAGKGSAERDVRAAVVGQADAWNRHDAAAYAALFTEKCDVVNVVGWWWKGRTELQQKLTEAFAFMFKDSTLTFTEVDVRFLRPDVALAHARWTMTGARTPPGLPEPRQGIQTLVLTKGPGGWLIDGFQNTNSLPERPFPKSGVVPPVQR